jgi:hypothetical protein
MLLYIAARTKHGLEHCEEWEEEAEEEEEVAEVEEGKGVEGGQKGGRGEGGEGNLLPKTYKKRTSQKKKNEKRGSNNNKSVCSYGAAWGHKNELTGPEGWRRVVGAYRRCEAEGAKR